VADAPPAAAAAAVAAAAGADASFEVEPVQLCAEGSIQSPSAAGSLALDDVFGGGFELECSPCRSDSHTGQGFDPSFGFGLAQDEDLGWLAGGVCGARGPC
jgi:hypothetical protein